VTSNHGSSLGGFPGRESEADGHFGSGDYGSGRGAIRICEPLPLLLRLRNWSRNHREEKRKKAAAMFAAAFEFAGLRYASLMLFSHTEADGEITRFRANPWLDQRTFKTPLKDLKRFVATLLGPFPLETGLLATDQVVFEPEHVLELLQANAIPVEDPWEFHFVAEGRQSIAELLEAVLSDWIDFLFVPIPTSFVIYADHDEYVTFYAANEKQLTALTSHLEQAGFEAVAGYDRP